MRKIIILFSLFFSISFYGQNDTISIVKTSNISVVSADKLNVVYVGLSNPISIAVPNCKSFKVEGKGLIKISDAKYELNPNFSDTITSIKVEILKYDDTLIEEEHFFRVKKVPPLITTINGNSSITVLNKKQFKDVVIKTNFNSEDFIYGAEFNIERFTVSFIKGRKKINTIIVNGKTFNKECLDQIDKLQNGDYIIISDQILSSNLKVGCVLTTPIIVLIYEL